jgi:TrmH family RNA methyltransferase
MITAISSHHNPQYREWKSLLSSKGLKESGLFILSGEKLFREFLERPSLEIDCELICEGLSPLSASQRIFRLTRELFESLDVSGTHFNLLILRQPRIPTWSPQDSSQGLELLAPVGDPVNLGALIRSAVGFGCAKIVLLKEAAHPYHPKCVKASSGAVFFAPLFRGPSIHDLKTNRLPDLIGLGTQGSIPLAQFHWPHRPLLLVGEEGPGLSFSPPTLIHIPTQKIESLNATVAASVALYSWSQANSKKPK